MRRIRFWAAVLVSASLLIAGCGPSGSRAPTTTEKAKVEQANKDMIELQAKMAKQGKLPMAGGTTGAMPGAPRGTPK